MSDTSLSGVDSFDQAYESPAKSVPKLGPTQRKLSGGTSCTWSVADGSKESIGSEFKGDASNARHLSSSVGSHWQHGGKSAGVLCLLTTSFVVLWFALRTCDRWAWVVRVSNSAA